MDNHQCFLEISAVLTGFSEVDLLATGMLNLYYDTMAGNTDPAVLQGFLAESSSILVTHAGDPAAINREVASKLLPPNTGNGFVPPYAGLAAAIVNMWYMGNWNGAPISPQSYVAGLIWGVAGTHPPGAKQPGYDSWSRVPIS